MKENNNKGFTLIELLAVVVILGLLMAIAIPSISKYVTTSKKKTYITTAQEYLSGITVSLNNGDLPLYDSDTTYYVPSSCIETETGDRSPNGEWKSAYAVITYGSDGFDYYWTSADVKNYGICLTHRNKLNHKLVNTSYTDVSTSTTVGTRTKIKVLDEICIVNNAKDVTPTNSIPEKGTCTNNSEPIYKTSWEKEGLIIKMSTDNAQCWDSGTAGKQVCQFDFEIKNTTTKIVKTWEGSFNFKNISDINASSLAHIMTAKLNGNNLTLKSVDNAYSQIQPGQSVKNGIQVTIDKGAELKVACLDIKLVFVNSGEQSQETSGGVIGNIEEMNKDVSTKMNVRLKRTSYWGPSDNYTAQYDVYIKNLGTSNLTSWQITLGKTTGIKSFDIYFGNKKVQGDKVIITPYNNINLAPNQELKLGNMQITFSDINSLPTIE